MRTNVLKTRKMLWVSALCLVLLSVSCEIASEPELEGPTQVELKPTLGSSDVVARMTDVGKDGGEIFDVTEIMPKPQGGMEGWNNYLSTNLKYPAQAREMGVEGTVIVTFVVNADGTVSHAEIIRGIGAGADEEALRVVQYSPKWTPAIQRGEMVNSRLRLPVQFKLSEKSGNSL